jgi:hypothetical protein
MLGCLAGALGHGLLEPWLTRLTNAGFRFKDSHYVDEALGKSYLLFSTLLVLMAVAAIVVLEVLEPWEEETPLPNRTPCYVFGCRSWPPWASGLVLGLLQLPAAVVLRQTLGSATGYSAVCSLTTSVFSSETKEKHYSAFSSMTQGWSNWCKHRKGLLHSFLSLSAVTLSSLLSFMLLTRIFSCNSSCQFTPAVLL